MPLQSETKGETLVLRITDDRLTDEAQLQRMYDDVVELLNKSTEQQVVMDFSPVQFMSSSMLGKLVNINKKCKEFKVKLKLSGISSEILQVFKITKLNKVFDIHSDTDAALKSFNKRGLFR